MRAAAATNSDIFPKELTDCDDTGIILLVLSSIGVLDLQKKPDPASNY